MCNTFNAQMLRISSEQIRLQVSPKLFRINSWIPQIIRQWIPESWSGYRNCTGRKGAVANSRNWQLVTSGRSQVLATSNFRDWHTVVGEIPWSSVPKTTMDCHSKLVLHLLRNNQPAQVIVHQPRQTTLIFPGPSDRPDVLQHFEHAATCPWPSSAWKTKLTHSSQCAMWQRQGLMS